MARRAIVVAAGDHGVARQGVSAYPSDVTAQMVANFVGGGAAINVLAAAAGASLTVVDVGVAGTDPATDLPGGERGGRLIRARIRAGTADMTEGPAMTRAEALRADRGRAGRRRPTCGHPASTSSASATWGSATPRRPARSWP